MLSALASRRGAPATKGDLAWETRANHYMITRVLRELVAAGHVLAEAGADAYRIRLTEDGDAFHARNRAYFETTFREALAEHFRYGKAPSWAAFARSA